MAAEAAKATNATKAAEAVREALGWPWVRQGDWAGSVLFRGQIFLGLHREVPAWTGVPEGPRGLLQAGPATWLVEGDLDRFAGAYLDLVRQEPRRILDLAARFEHLMGEVEDLTRRLEQGPPRGASALAEVAARYAALDMASQPYSYVFGYGEDAIVARLVQDLAGDPAAVADLLVAPADVPTDLQAAQDALLDLAELAEGTGLRPGGPMLQPRAVREALAAHVARFGDGGGDAAEVLASARVHVGRAAAERARRRRDAEAREARWAAAVAGLGLPAEGRALLAGLRRQVGIRTWRRERWMRARAAYQPHLAAMARALDLPLPWLHRLTHEEVLAGLRGAPLPDLAAREAGMALLAAGGRLHVLTGDEAHRLRTHAEGGAARPAGDVLTGLGASPGIVRGVVRIVAGPAEGAKVGQGDILVTDMTEPDLALACGRSAAIVTDLGGMLCHAAIVSRELGIPCVLGTGQATRWLRDGDLVEVDGAAGRVVVLRRAGRGAPDKR